MLRNLTPHAIHICAPGTCDVVRTIEPTGLARANVPAEGCDPVDGIPTDRRSVGLPTGLPEPQDGVYLIVALVVVDAARAAGRAVTDLLTPGEMVRTPARVVIGCSTLTRHA